jgi:Domain of unknown function (DUF1963)
MREEDRLLYADLEARLRAMGLGRVAESVLRLARPAIRLDLTPTEEKAISVGATKVGGSADLPPDVAWPWWRGGPLPFITQVRLEEVAGHDPEGDLPHQGLLSFFYAPTDPESGEGVDEDFNVDPTAWRLVYTPDTTRLERRQEQWPRPERLFYRFQTAYPACAVACSRRLTLPNVEAAAVRALGFTNDERLGYIDLVSGESAGFETEMDHRLLGYPYTLNPDPFLSGYLARNGIERPTLPEDPAGQERLERAKAILAEQAQTWRLPLPGDYRGPEGVARAIADLTAAVDIAALHQALAGLGPTPPPPPAYLARMEALRWAAEAEWRLLLQIYSNDEAEMVWPDVLHVGIAQADLATRDFSRVWVKPDFM